MKLVLIFSCLGILADSRCAAAGRVIVEIGANAGIVEKNCAALLAERIEQRRFAAVTVREKETGASFESDALTIFLGRPDRHEILAEYLVEADLKPLTEMDPGPEGFLLYSLPHNKGRLLLAAGVDDRGVLYAVGEILRQMERNEDPLAFPKDYQVRTAPAFEVRGTQFEQGGKMLQVTGARHWGEKEWQTAILDDALAGANTFEAGVGKSEDDPVLVFLRSFGLQTLAHYSANAGSGPAEWKAKESIGRTGYLCPSVPEARKALLQQCENRFKNSASLDYVRFVSGDGGGCEGDECKPYGRTYIQLCADYAEIVHRYHPDTEIFITNQKLNNEDDLAIFEYLNEKPRPWLRAFCYGPGSDAMTWQQGRRQNHRMDLFRYPGFGPFDRYLNEILHALPIEQDIVFFNEITHWYYSQYGYVHFQPPPDLNGDTPPHWGHFIYERHPDPYLVAVYERQTFYAWPRYYHYVFGEIMRYGIGDVTHSSGHHDHFNQWMWQRLLWSPHMPVEEVVEEYATAWFGRKAAPEMAEAIFQMEINLSDPLLGNGGIDRYYDLVKQAGREMGDAENNWLWLQFMQKGSIDKYTQLAAQQQTDLQTRIEKRIAKALESGKAESAIAKSLTWLEKLGESKEMKKLRAEAGRLGERSDELFGVRSTGYFNLEHDFVGLGWIERQLRRAHDADEQERIDLLERIAHYEEPGEGGFYDNVGAPGGSPRLSNGTQFDHGQPYTRMALSEANRPSQRVMAFTAHEEQGVTLDYEALDPQAQYRVRFTLLRPVYQERYAMRMNQERQTIYADDLVLAKELELPEHMSEFFEFDIPRAATRDGALQVRFQKGAGVAEGPRVQTEIWRNSGGWGTLVSEVWLMKKE